MNMLLSSFHTTTNKMIRYIYVIAFIGTLVYASTDLNVTTGGSIKWEEGTVAYLSRTGNRLANSCTSKGTAGTATYLLDIGQTPDGNTAKLVHLTADVNHTFPNVNIAQANPFPVNHSALFATSGVITESYVEYHVSGSPIRTSTEHTSLIDDQVDATNTHALFHRWTSDPVTSELTFDFTKMLVTDNHLIIHETTTKQAWCWPRSSENGTTTGTPMNITNFDLDEPHTYKYENGYFLAAVYNVDTLMLRATAWDDTSCALGADSGGGLGAVFGASTILEIKDYGMVDATKGYILAVLDVAGERQMSLGIASFWPDSAEIESGSATNIFHPGFEGWAFPIQDQWYGMVNNARIATSVDLATSPPAHDDDTTPALEHDFTTTLFSANITAAALLSNETSNGAMIALVGGTSFRVMYFIDGQVVLGPDTPITGITTGCTHMVTSKSGSRVTVLCDGNLIRRYWLSPETFAMCASSYQEYNTTLPVLSFGQSTDEKFLYTMTNDYKLHAFTDNNDLPSCDTGYYGADCEWDLATCNQERCSAGAGTCTGDRTGCDCTPSGLFGETCAQSQVGCNINRCGNGVDTAYGTCTDQLTGCTCTQVLGDDVYNATDNCQSCLLGPNVDVTNECGSCTSGYFGATCNMTQAQCDTSRCNDHGTCTNRLLGCTCTGGYTGTTCETAPLAQAATATPKTTPDSVTNLLGIWIITGIYGLAIIGSIVASCLKSPSGYSKTNEDNL